MELPALRKENSRRVESLQPELDEIIQRTRNLGFEAERAGDRDTAEARFLEAWATLPEPRHIWDSSSIMALDLVSFYLDCGRFDDALKWLAIAEQADEGLVNAANLIWYGKIRYEQGNASEAFRAFDAVYRVWRKRPFSGHAHKYLEFYESQKKAVK